MKKIARDKSTRDNRPVKTRLRKGFHAVALQISELAYSISIADLITYTEEWAEYVAMQADLISASPPSYIKRLSFLSILNDAKQSRTH